ncbi:MAG: hypothetical protein PSU89_18825, partial [Methylobacter sp.]|nr:hypothetical protein [Methylobacter sp.]MDI1360278.1 hypothetical protein [Methylobacter sp.]
TVLYGSENKRLHVFIYTLGALSIRAQNSASYTAQGLPNPYPVLFGGLPTYQVLNGLPFNKMQFLPMDYGRP